MIDTIGNSRYERAEASMRFSFRGSASLGFPRFGMKDLALRGLAGTHSHRSMNKDVIEH